MRYSALTLAHLGMVLAVSQRPAKSGTAPKTGGLFGGLAGLLGGNGSGGLSSMLRGGGGSGSNPFTLLGTYLNGSEPASAETLAKLIKSMGQDPSQGVTAMVCETFKPGNSMGKTIGAIFGNPNGKGPNEQCMVDRSGGSGPYPANYTEDPSLPYHTIYVPKQKPKGKMPVIIWANGFCMSAGTMFANFHNEIASHGFMIVANGPIKGGVTGFTTDKELTKSINWVMSNPAARRWGDIDTSKLVVAGQSCGGEEASAVSKDPRVKLTVLFNSPVFGATNPKTLKNPIAYFLGGPSDMAQSMGERHWKNIPSNIPALQGTNPIGHIGSYYQKYGGKTGRVAVSFFKWQLKGVQSEKAQFCGPPGSSALMKEGNVFKSKNKFC